MNKEYYDKRSGLSKSIIEAEIDYFRALSNIKKLKENQQRLEYKIANEMDLKRQKMFISIKKNIDELLLCATNRQEELKRNKEERDLIAVKFMMLSKRILSKEVYDTIYTKAKELLDLKQQ